MFRATVPSRILAAAAVATGLLSAPAASAYCRATPCNPSSGMCGADAHGCSTEGPTLFWSEGHVTMSVDDGGSALRGISGDDAVAAVSEALGAWQMATCAGGEHPSLKTMVDHIAGATADFNGGGPNESVVLFNDTGWPFEAKAVARTTIGMNLDTGEILDADIQLNSQKFALAYDAGAGTIDLVAVLTHEIGHVLGLGHSDVAGATMEPETTGFGTAELRTLAPDDEKGICAIYPPGGSPAGGGDSDPTGTTSGDSSGCSVSPRGSAGSASILVLACTVALSRRRKRP